MIFGGSTLPSKCCLFLETVSLGRMLDQSVKIIVVMKLLFCFFPFKQIISPSLENHKISILFIIGVPEDHMSSLWDHIGFQELGQIIFWCFFLVCIKHTQATQPQFFSK